MKPWEKDQKIGAENQTPWSKDKKVDNVPTGVLPYAKETFGGVNTGIANTVGAPVDITNFILSSVGIGANEPVGGSKWLKKQMSKTGDMFFKPQIDTPLGKGLRRVGEEVGMSTVPAMGITRAATKARPVYESSSGLIRKLFLDPIKRSPGKATFGELTATVGSGVGASVAENVAPGNKIAETTGQVIGAATPEAMSKSTIGLVYKGTQKLVSRFSKKAQQEVASKAVKEALNHEISSDARKNLKDAVRLKSRLSDKNIEWEPSIGEITNSKSLLRQQADVEGKASGQFLDKIQQRRQLNQQAIDKFVKQTGFDSEFDADYIIDTANNRVKTVSASIDSALSKVADKKLKHQQTLPNIDRMASGKLIRDGIAKAKSDTSLKMSLRAKELGVADVDLSEPFGQFKNEIKQKYSPDSRFEDTKSMPSIFREIISDKNREVTSGLLDASGNKITQDVKTTFNDIKAIRERISDDIINESGTATPNRKKLRTLIRMKQDVDNFLENQTGKLGEQYKQFRSEYFENYIKPFESGAIFKAKNKDGTGFFRTNNEHVASLFFDNPSAAQQYKEIFQESPEMLDALKNAALDDMRRYATDDGVINQRKLSTWIKKKQEAIEQIPEIKELVSDFQTTQKQLDGRAVQLAGRKKKIQNLALVKQLTNYSKNETTSDQIIIDALKKPVKMARLNNYIKRDVDAQESLKRIIWEKATQGNSESVLKFMGDHEKSLKVLYGKKHFEDMADISMLKAINERAVDLPGQAIDSTAAPKIFKMIEDKTGMKIPQFGTRMYAWKSGRVPKHYLVAEAAMATLRRSGATHADKIWKEALYDPKIAMELAKSVFDGNFTKQKAKRLGARLTALGVPYLEDKNDNLQ